MAEGWPENKVGHIGEWSFGGVCDCGADATCMVLVLGGFGVMWHRACDTCAPTIAAMACMDKVVNGS